MRRNQYYFLLVILFLFNGNVHGQVPFPEDLNSGDSLFIDAFNGGCYGGTPYRVVVTSNDSASILVDFISFQPSEYKISAAEIKKDNKYWKEKNERFLEEHSLQLDTFYTVQNKYFDTLFTNEDSYFVIDVKYKEQIDTSLVFPFERLQVIRELCDEVAVRNANGYKSPFSGSYGSISISWYDSQKNTYFASDTIKFKGSFPLSKNHTRRLE